MLLYPDAGPVTVLGGVGESGKFPAAMTSVVCGNFRARPSITLVKSSVPVGSVNPQLLLITSAVPVKPANAPGSPRIGYCASIGGLTAVFVFVKRLYAE